MFTATQGQAVTNLKLVVSRPRAMMSIAKGETQMNAYRFAAYPSNSAVAAGVTLIVSVWFLVAAGAILSDPPSQYTQRVVKQDTQVAMVEPVQAKVVPHVKYTVMVIGKRSAS